MNLSYYRDKDEVSMPIDEDPKEREDAHAVDLAGVIREACDAYMQETNFGIFSLFFHTYEGECRANKIAKYAEHLQREGRGHGRDAYLLANAALNSRGGRLRSYIARYISYSGIFQPKHVDQCFSQLRFIISKDLALERGILELISQKVDDTERMLRLRKNIDDIKEAVNYDLVDN